MATLRELIIKISAKSQSFQSEIARASRLGSDYYKTMQKGGRQAAAAARESQRAIRDLNSQIVTAGAALNRFAGAAAGAFAAGNLIRIADSYNSLSARIKLATKDSEDFTAAQNGLMRISQYTGSQFADNAALFSRAASSLREWGYGTQDILNLTDALATGLQVSGASAEETSSLIVQLSQALGRGVLRGQDFNSVAQSGQRIMKALADGLGVAQKDLKGFADAGQLTTDKIVPALISQVGQLHKEFDSMPDSVSAASSRVKNAFMEWVGGANNASGATKSLAGVLNSASQNIDGIATAAGVLVAVGLARFLGNATTSAISASGALLNAAKSEVALASAQLRGAQVATARARAAVYRAQQALVAARATDAQAAVEKRLAVAQVALTRNIAARTAAQAAVNSVTSVGSRLLTGTLGLVGGLPGLLLLGAGAWFTIHQRQEEARKSAEAYGKTIDEVRGKIPNLSLTATADNTTQTRAALDEQNRQVAAQAAQVRKLKEEVNGLNYILSNPGKSFDGFLINHLMHEETAIKKLAEANTELRIEQARLAEMQDYAAKIQGTLSDLESRRNGLLRDQAVEENKVYQSLLLMNGQHTQFNSLLSLGNKLLSERAGIASAPLRIPTAALNEKQTEALQKSEEAQMLSRLKGFARARREAELEADKLGLTNTPEYTENRNRLINSKLETWQNSQTAKKTGGGGKTEEQKTADSYKKLIEQQKEQLALAGRTTEQARLKYQLSQGELRTLSETQKQTLLQNAALIDQSKIKQQLVAYEQNLADANASARAANDATLFGYGRGERSRQQALELLKIRADFEQKNVELQRQYADGMSEDLYQKSVVLNKQFLEERLADQQAFYVASEAQRGDWQAGFSEGFANWADTASDYATQSASVVNNAFSGLIDNISDALSGNKASWSDWANSVLQSLQKVLLNAVLVENLKGLGGSLGGQGGTLGSIGGWITGAIKPNAKGGTYESSSLSAYSGSIVNRPTYFAFAKGAGLMGEAGPEAIMPLTRSADGSLGVRVTSDPAHLGGASTQAAVINQHFTINGNGDAALIRAMEQAARKGAADGAKQARNDMLNDFQTRGQARRMLGV